MPRPAAWLPLVALASLPASVAARPEARPHPAPRGAPRWIADPIVGRLRLVPHGRFAMGAKDGETDEQPEHTVAVSAFYLMESEVTQRMWRAVMASPPSKFDGCDACPVERVTWEEARAFARALSARTPGATYRLPTEAEWEYAARGGQRHTFAGADEVERVGWVSLNSGGTTHPVCEKHRNALDLCDMSGNVWEWTADRYGPYADRATVDPHGPMSGPDRVARGGSWLHLPERARVVNRSWFSPSERLDVVGFRLARVID